MDPENETRSWTELAAELIEQRKQQRSETDKTNDKYRLHAGKYADQIRSFHEFSADEKLNLIATKIKSHLQSGKVADCNMCESEVL